MKKIQEFIRGTTWELESFQSEDKNGEIVYPLGQEARGFIMFTPENRISVHIMAANREAESKTQSSKIEFLTEAEEKMAELGYHAYSGPFVINEEEEILETHIEVSLVISYIGSKQPRKVKIEADKLYLTNVSHPERKLVWRKLEK